LRIRIYYDEINFRVKSWRKIVKLIEKVIRNEVKIPGDLCFIITSNQKLRDINIQFLEHDYDTDVITFNYNEGKVINGEVYISYEMVKSNAIRYKVGLGEEILRVIIHGVLHLAGHDDKTEEQKVIMRKREDDWIRQMNT
jgi:probable rRNA maturation factor